MSEATVYTPRRSYTVLAGAGALLALLFAWEIGQSFDWATLFFAVVALLFAGVNLFSALSSVELTPTGLTAHRRFASPQHIDFRQIVSVATAARLSTGLSLVYYPLRGDGLLDLDTPRSLFLPSLERQEDLLATLQREIIE